ncbi:MAG TPA: glycosyl hydrolase family 28-related protein, partial [Candidatus Bathyarchaeia archaeon]
MVLTEYDITKPEGNLSIALGNGSDATQAIQERLDLIQTAGGGSIYIPAGTYVINKTLHVKHGGPSKIRGAGQNTFLLWNFDRNLFEWDNGAFSYEVTDLFINATVDMNKTSTAFKLITGITNFLTIKRVHIDTSNATPRPKFGTGILVASPGNIGACGSLRFQDLEFWNFKGDGIKLSNSTDVWISNCRMPGIGKPKGSVGVHLAGNTGGIWIKDCDLIDLDNAIRVDRPVSRKALPNRELFVTGGACDSSKQGLVIRDNTFVTLTGSWFASCIEGNIFVAKGFSPHMEITGGIIFNGGANGPPAPYTYHGVVINGGEFAMSGVLVKNNYGKGLIVGERVNGYAVTGCVFVDN